MKAYIIAGVVILTISCWIMAYFYIKRMTWIGSKEYDYINRAKEEISHPTHRQRVILWIQSEEAENLYVKSPKRFPDEYKNVVDNIGDDLIEELREKYENEYQSRNTKNTKTV